MDNSMENTMIEDNGSVSSADSQQKEFEQLFNRNTDDRKVDEPSKASVVDVPADRDSASTSVGNENERVFSPTEADEKKKGNKSDRYGEIKRKYHKAVERAEAAEKRLKEFQDTQKPIDKTAYDSVDSWLKDSIAAETKAKLLEEQAEASRQQTQEAESEMWTERCREQVSNFDDFAEQYNKYVGNIDEITAGFVADSEHGPKILDDFFKHADANKHFLTIWKSLPTAEKYKTLIQLETYVSQPKQTEQTKATAKPVPRPLAPEGNSASSQPVGQQELFDQLFKNRKR